MNNPQADQMQSVYSVLSAICHKQLKAGKDRRALILYSELMGYELAMRQLGVTIPAVEPISE